MSDLMTQMTDAERAEDLRALSKMAAHMETLLDDIGIDDSTPRFCLQTFRALIAKELDLALDVPGSRPRLEMTAEAGKIN